MTGKHSIGVMTAISRSMLCDLPEISGFMEMYSEGIHRALRQMDTFDSLSKNIKGQISVPVQISEPNFPDGDEIYLLCGDLCRYITRDDSVVGRARLSEIPDIAYNFVIVEPMFPKFFCRIVRFAKQMENEEDARLALGIVAPEPSRLRPIIEDLLKVTNQDSFFRDLAYALDALPKE